MVICYVLGCKSRSERKCENITFHSFPKDCTIRQLWIRATGRENWDPNKYARVCSKHFEQKCFRKTPSNTYLESFSVPTLHIVTKQFSNISGLQTSNTTREAQRTYESNRTRKSNSTSECDRTSECKTSLTKQVQDIIARVYNYLQAEYEQLKNSIGAHCDLSPLANILARTAAATGVSEHAVSAILEERKRSADEELLLDDGAAKRAKFTCDGGEILSPITDESTCDAPYEERDEVTDPDEDDEHTDDDSEGQDECRLKMEIKIEDENEPFDLLQSQMNEMESAVGHVISSTYNSCPDSDTIVRKPVRDKIEPDMVDTESKPKVVPTISPQVQLRGSAFEVTRVACDDPYTPVDVIPHSSGASTSDIVMDVKIEPDIP